MNIRGNDLLRHVKARVTPRRMFIKAMKNILEKSGKSKIIRIEVAESATELGVMVGDGGG